jgi:death-on-curing protein
MKHIGLDNILAFHTKIISKTGGSDRGLIESALNRAFVTFDGKDLYKEVEKKISVITRGVIRNHGFIDGILLLIRKIQMKDNMIFKDSPQKPCEPS